VNKTEEYLRQKFAETKFPFFGLRNTITECGPGTMDELKELKTRGMLRSRPGISGFLIELLNTDKWLNNNELK